MKKDFNEKTGLLLRVFEAVADFWFDGHFTLMRFTTGYRACFGTVNDYEQIKDMIQGTDLQDVLFRVISKHFEKIDW